MTGGSAATVSPVPCAAELLQTARTALRRPRDDDRGSLIELLTSCDVRQFLGGALSPESAEQRVDQIIAGAQTAACWSIHHGEAQRCIGLVELAPHHDGSDTEISYQLLPAFWGQGIGFETVSAVIGYALLGCGLNRLVAETREANTASRNLLQRCGMKEYRRIQRFGAAQVIYGIEVSDRLTSG